jgi:hypothetical protein
VILLIVDSGTTSSVKSVAYAADRLQRRFDTPAAGPAVACLTERARQGLEEPTPEPGAPDLDGINQVMARLPVAGTQQLAARDLTSAAPAILGVTHTSRRSTLDHATGELTTPTNRHDRQMRWAGRSATIIALLAFVAPVPHAALLARVLFLTVLCAAVLISMDYVGSGHGLSLVHGVRYVVTNACGARP